MPLIPHSSYSVCTFRQFGDYLLRDFMSAKNKPKVPQNNILILIDHQIFSKFMQFFLWDGFTVPVKVDSNLQPNYSAHQTWWAADIRNMKILDYEMFQNFLYSDVYSLIKAKRQQIMVWYQLVETWDGHMMLDEIWGEWGGCICMF